MTAPDIAGQVAPAHDHGLDPEHHHHGHGHHHDGHVHEDASEHNAAHEAGHGLEGYHVHGGAPALDIGGDVGALVALMDRTALGTELHLQSEHEPSIAVHTGVWERQHGSQQVVAAVFAELLEGAYQVLVGAGEEARRVEIEGGRVTTVDLRS